MTGVLYMLLGSASVGLSFVYAKKFLSDLDIPPVALTTHQIGLALLTLTIVTDLDGITAITGDPKAMIGLVIGLGILGTGVAYILYYFIVDTSERLPRRARPTSLWLSRSPSAGSSSKNPWTSWMRPPSSSS
jgi:hypothetical protein